LLFGVVPQEEKAKKKKYKEEQARRILLEKDGSIDLNDCISQESKFVTLIEYYRIITIRSYLTFISTFDF